VSTVGTVADIAAFVIEAAAAGARAGAAINTGLVDEDVAVQDLDTSRLPIAKAVRQRSAQHG
jgi:hypothetical protein